MKEKLQKYILTGFTLLIVIATASCSLPTSPAGSNTGAEGTSVAQTVAALTTKSALETLLAQVTPQNQAGTPQPGVTSDIFQSTPTATNTQVIMPSSTPTIATGTPTNTPIPTTAVPTAIPCNWAGFVTDVSIPDGTQFPAGATFTKIWRLKNIGTCTWTSDYALVFASGNGMNGATATNLGSTIAPGQTIDVSVNLVAPTTLGDYTGYWKLRAGNGTTFALGNNAATAFWVTIKVISNPPTPDPSKPLDFAANICNAAWSSTAAATLPCSGAENFTAGSVSYTNTPIIEPAYNDNESTIVMIPPNGSGGTISGKYPAMTVLAGDHFVALAGCMTNSTNCTVNFTLSYIEGSNPPVGLGTWTETYDGNRTNIDVDLSALAGKSVQFVLSVSNNNNSSTDDRAFWEAAKIKR